MIRKVFLFFFFLLIPLFAFADQKACLTSNGTLVIAKKCKAKKGQQEFNLSSISNSVQGLQGPMGESGKDGNDGVQGPKGDKGDSGANGVLGYESINSVFTNVLVNSGTQTTQVINCPAGKVVLGGSCFFSGSDAIFFTYIGTKIVSGNPDQWQCIIRNPSGSNRFIDITVTATCATPS